MNETEIDVIRPDNYAFTALHYACQDNKTEIFENETQVQLLLQKPQNLDAKVNF